MDEIFKRFENWYLNKKIRWEQAGISVDEAGLSKYGHQYWIKLHSECGLGNIILYESNGYYWVDFESGNYNCNDIYQKSGIEFEKMSDLNKYETEFIKIFMKYKN